MGCGARSHRGENKIQAPSHTTVVQSFYHQCSNITSSLCSVDYLLSVGASMASRILFKRAIAGAKHVYRRVATTVQYVDNSVPFIVVSWGYTAYHMYLDHKEAAGKTAGLEALSAALEKAGKDGKASWIVHPGMAGNEAVMKASLAARAYGDLIMAEEKTKTSG